LKHIPIVDASRFGGTVILAGCIMKETMEQRAFYLCGIKINFAMTRHVVGNDFIAIVGQHIKSSSICVVVNVYATCNYRDKVTLWKVLTSLNRTYQNMVGCFCGDFNAVRREDERKGIRGSSDGDQEEEENGVEVEDA